MDTSLIAAIVADYVSDASQGNDLTSLREILIDLATAAEKELVDSDGPTDFSANHLSAVTSLRKLAVCLITNFG